MEEAMTMPDLLRRAELRQLDVAVAADVSTVAVGAWCNGTAYPGIDRLPKLAETLGVDIGTLVRALIETRRRSPG